MYTLIIHPDNTFVYRIDNIEEAHGKLEDGWKFLAPKTINDPEDKKPADWVDEAQIPDPEDKKPEDWDDVPAEIPDPSATKPEDWDDEDDGEWEAPMIPNPEYNVCKDCQYVGFELWQVKSGTIFDDIIVTDSVAEAETFAQETFFKKQNAEKKMYDAMKEAEKKAQEEELKAAGEAEDESYEDEEDSEL